MDTNQLLETIKTHAGDDSNQSRRVLECFTEALKECYANGDSVAIPGFGTFQTVKRDEWIRTDDISGKRYLMPPCVELVFKSSVVLRKKLLG
ncbi:MAG: HU family DNA-binding protein [Firmicutes bacterium]|nr:HU family DNA-binding protein [Bacillota bacterium]MCM1400835.1 HU family DNA-binding protein [Bacteroides sp.]MCM1476674.1 HU family DNA-binding protein [Bacteroides sp.]